MPTSNSRRRTALAGMSALFISSTILGTTAESSEIPNGQAKDRGCRTGGPSYDGKELNSTKPEWVSVNPLDTVAGPLGELPERGNPGRPETVEGNVILSKVTSEDWPFSHNSHDWIWYMSIDPKYYHKLVSNGNETIENLVRDHRFTNYPRAMEMEWETAYFPINYYPAKGDRAWMMGRHVFDCGHPPYRSEIHPAKAVAFTRREPRISNVVEAGIPGGPPPKADKAPSFTNVTHVWIHGRGGYYDAPVANQTYEFDIQLPPRPSPNAKPIAFDASTRGQQRGTLGKSVSPTLTPMPANNPTKVHVKIPLNMGDSSPNQSFGATIVTGWREEVLTRAYRKMRITFESIKVLSDHDGTGAWDGEWRMYLQAGPRWLRPNSAARGELDDVGNGETVNFSGVAHEFFVPEDGAFYIQTSGWESDRIDGIFGVRRNPRQIDWRLAHNNQRLGLVAKTFYARDNFGIGRHDDISTSGDFRIRYRIQETERFPVGANIKDAGRTPPSPPPAPAPGPPAYKCEQVPRLCGE